jgi:selenocysteine-specific elongation factor
MKSHTIIGTAGHIDHGKTALIRALTGVDTDRLKEEKERGITIDIGFAYWKDSVTVIDVPGHEKFIRNMVAGVSTIDFFILVIAADDGIMPQTIEHLDILKFFNVTDGIAVINKTDLVDEEWLELVTEDVQRMLNRYDLAGIPILSVSAVTGTNIDNLRELLETKIKQTKEISSDKPFRLFVDRSFSIKGFGTVVTGTVLSGVVQKGDELTVLPVNKLVKVRGLQSHTTDVDRIGIGNRAAINLQGIEKNEIIRGDMLTSDGMAFPVKEFTGIMQTVSKIPLKVQNRSYVHIYVGTAERYGQLIWFENKKSLGELETFHVRVKLDTPVGAAVDDVFLIRSRSPVYTLAGGKIIEINPPRISHKPDEWKSYFNEMSSPEIQNKITNIVLHARQRIVSLRLLSQKLYENHHRIKGIVDQIVKTGTLRLIEIGAQPHVIHTDKFKYMANSIIHNLGQFHLKYPLRDGLNKQELINLLAWKWLPEELVDGLLKYLINQNKIRQEQNIFALSEFKIRMSRDTDTTISNMLAILAVKRFEPPVPADLAEQLGITKDETESVIRKLAKDNRLIAISNQMYIHHQTWEDLLKFLRSYFVRERDLPVSALKDFIQTTRKYAIPLFEYLDSEGFTRRVGDVRQKGTAL